MIKYIGSKRKLISNILDTVLPLHGVNTVVDLFSGTSRVGYAFKEKGYRVISNDLYSYAHLIATCHVQSDFEDVYEDVKSVIDDLNKVDNGYDGYFTETFCVKSRYIQPFNGRRIDKMRDMVDEMDLNDEVRACVITSIIEATDKVDSTVGLQMAYLKGWSKRSFNKLVLEIPDILPKSIYGKCQALKGDATEITSTISADLFYLDPPYNQHSYLGNYHVWESLTLWDKPEVYGIACKRIDVRERKSAFNTKNECLNSMRNVVRQINAPYVLVSFNNEGYISKSDMFDMLSVRGDVTIQEIDYKRYIGHSIGIYNPSGEKVGTEGKSSNKEYLFLLKIW